jgi:hypothetical protein
VFHHAEFLTDCSLAVASDGSQLLWAQIDNRLGDPMLVANFR